jgi:hypothetical protein
MLGYCLKHVDMLHDVTRWHEAVKRHNDVTHMEDGI